MPVFQILMDCVFKINFSGAMYSRVKPPFLRNIFMSQILSHSHKCYFIITHFIVHKELMKEMHG